MGRLEREIASPRAPPARIADVVSRIHSGTLDAPRNLSESLLARLEEIAEFNEGTVPLHGRLFSQWMHHAYPRECPFPPMADAERPMTPDEWHATKRPFYVSEQQKSMYRKLAKDDSPEA